ncbi:ABC transporter ATP-binding protein [Amaricoccus macauensis]|uniref:ABC transporter ATP-binding protein n=1 Tax=Amaricoccus macauensis TaxID=57001 RepID=UPI003C7DAD15
MADRRNYALRLADIFKVYNSEQPGKIRVLDGACLELAQGEIVALAGPSGSGKSTLLHIAGLLDVPSSGHVLIGKENFSEAGDRARTAARRDKIGFVYQFHHLLPEFSARDNIILPQQAAGENLQNAKERAECLLDQVGLLQRADHKPAELSGGEQQRVAIARALANSPSLLLADEPTGNLDPETACVVFDLLLGLVRETGLAALIATHNLELAARMDRTLQICNGRVIVS